MAAAVCLDVRVRVPSTCVQETWCASRDEQPSRCRCGRLWSGRILWCQAQRCSVTPQPGGSTLHPLSHDNQRLACLRSRPRTGQCSHAQGDAARLDCPREPLGCQATFLPLGGSATRSNGRCALSPLAAPQGAHKEGTGAATLCPCDLFLSPPIPLVRGLCLSLRACDAHQARPAPRWRVISHVSRR